MSALTDVLQRFDRLAIAVSGGVDSMTLAFAAHQVPGLDARIVHAVSPAVDGASTDRVTSMARSCGWDLHIIEPGEFGDPEYLRNPVNRCFFCKTNLYRRISQVVSGGIASGTNVDDLGDYRPGLQAAADHQVVHPFVEAGMKKRDVRAMAREFGLDGLAELPAQPCLASRIETGIAIDPADLRFVETMEHALRDVDRAGALRCRIVRGGVRVEVAKGLLSNARKMGRITSIAENLCAKDGRSLLGIAEYKRGAAFLHDA